MKYILITILVSLTAATQLNGGFVPDSYREPAQAPTVAYSRSTAPTPYWLACPALVTAYSPYDPLDSDYVLTKGADRWNTSTMVDVRSTPYGVAVDPRALPYDTQLVVPGYLSVTAPNAVYQPDDTGGKLRQSWSIDRLLHVDVRFATHESANRWGVRYQIIWVLVMPASALEHRLLTHNVRHQWPGQILGLPTKTAATE